VKSVLLVDDNKDLRTTLKEILVMEDYAVVEACTYCDALARLGGDFDIALFDYQLRDGNGIDLLHEVRKTSPSLPVIIMTGYGTEEIAVRSFRTGASDYVRKPLDIRFLLRKMAESLGKETDAEGGTPPGDADGDDLLMEGVAMYLRKNHGPGISLEKVSAVWGTSRFRICRLFTEKLGQGFSAYVNGLRIEHAKELFRNPTLSILDITHAAGFGSLSQFERVFKETEGVTPREYRKGNRT
jgi:two-component system, response regulator YesN